MYKIHCIKISYITFRVRRAGKQHTYMCIYTLSGFILGFPDSSAGKESTCNAGYLG